VRVEIKVQAREDLARIHDFNAQRSERLAERVESRLLDRCEALPETPYIGRRISAEGVRRLSVADIQYVIDYRATTDAIEILRFQSSREVR